MQRYAAIEGVSQVALVAEATVGAQSLLQFFGRARGSGQGSPGRGIAAVPDQRRRLPPPVEGAAAARQTLTACSGNWASTHPATATAPG